MTCEECKEKLVERAEGLLESASANLVAAHLTTCEACRREETAITALHDRLVRAGARQAASKPDRITIIVNFP